MKNLGRGMSETTVAAGEEVDAALVAKIRVQEENHSRGGRPPLIRREAARIVEQLSQAEVDDVVPAGGFMRPHRGR